MGHVGPPLGSTLIRLVDVPDMNYLNAPRDQYADTKLRAVFDDGKNKTGGEVWVGGPSVSPGYYDPSVDGSASGLPSNGMAQKTAEDFFMEDGYSWFKTGDIGKWSDQGTLQIIDRRKNMYKTSLGEYVPVEEVEKVFQDDCKFADFVFIPKETKVGYISAVVVVSDSIEPVMRWAAEVGVAGDAHQVVGSTQFREHLFNSFQVAAKGKKLQRFLWIQCADNIHAEYHPIGYQDAWIRGVPCPNGKTEQLMTATFKARRSQLEQFFAPVFPKIYPDRPEDHVLP